MRDARNAIHIALTAVMAWLSFALHMPGDTFSNTGFREFASLATEDDWAYLFLAVAFIGLLGLVTERRWVRLISVLCLSTMHGTVAWCFYLGTEPGHPLTTGTGTYAIIAGLGYYLSYRRFLT